MLKASCVVIKPTYILKTYGGQSFAVATPMVWNLLLLKPSGTVLLLIYLNASYLKLWLFN